MSRFKFRGDVVRKWQSVWERLCIMAYTRTQLDSAIVVYPTNENEVMFYERNRCSNAEEITLDYTWEKFSKSSGEARVVPELKHIFVPRSLFECLGVYAWFRHSFPNCVIEFWEDSQTKNGLGH